MLHISDYLDQYDQLHKKEILELRNKRRINHTDASLQDYVRSLKQLPLSKPSRIELNQDCIEIGRRSDLTSEEHECLLSALQAFIPWKKGPFSLFGTMIDSEWRSELKWRRLQGRYADLKDKRVADIGCNNGYFMFRMLAEAPELIVGFEPVAKHCLCFELLNKYINADQIFYERLGVEHLVHFPRFFNTVFCLGILYHHTDPISLLRGIHASLETGGELIIDCQGIPGENPVALCPRSRYCGATGIWQLPTKTCLEHWLKRVNFRHISCFYDDWLSPHEQRRTPWAPIASLSDFLDPHDPLRTIEGYPAPRRFYFRAVK